MSADRILFLCLILAFFVLCCRGDEPAPGDKAGAGDNGVQKGMSPDRVQKLLGRPKKIARQILFRRHLEQWTYDPPTAMRIEFDCIRGQEAHVVSVHSLRPQKP